MEVLVVVKGLFSKSVRVPLSRTGLRLPRAPRGIIVMCTHDATALASKQHDNLFEWSWAVSILERPGSLDVEAVLPSALPPW